MDGKERYPLGGGLERCAWNVQLKSVQTQAVLQLLTRNPSTTVHCVMILLYGSG